MSFDLSFDKSAEPVFLKSYFRNNIRHMQASMILGTLIWALFGLVDFWVAPRNVLTHLLFIRYAIVCPIMALCSATSFFPQPQRHMDFAIAIGILAAAFSVIIRTTFLPVTESAISALSLLVVFIYGYVVMRPRFVFGSITGGLMVIGYGIVVIWIRPIPHDMLIKNLFYLFMGNLLGMYTSYQMEAYVLLDYLNTHRLQKEILERIKIAQELERHKNHLEELVRARTKELDKTQHEIVYVLAAASEYRDTCTGQHIQRMSQICAMVGKELGFSEDDCELLRHASAMHDIGKIGIPDHILLKSGELTPKEWEIMKAHTTIGAQILSQSDCALLQMARMIAMSHHECWDGSGYPNGLAAENIPLVGRIACLCDVFDSLLSHRPYKESWSLDKTIEHLQRMNGKLFDPKVYEAFHRILPKVLSCLEGNGNKTAPDSEGAG